MSAVKRGWYLLSEGDTKAYWFNGSMFTGQTTPVLPGVIDGFSVFPGEPAAA